MTALLHFVDTPLAAAVGWTVLHSLWQGGLIAAILAVGLVPARSPRIRYAAACLGLCTLLAASGFTLDRMLPRGAEVRLIHPAAFPQDAQPGSLERIAPWSPVLAGAAPWLAPFWLAGVLVFYLRQAAGLAGIHRLRRRGVCCASDHWQHEVRRLGSQLRVSRPVQLLESSLAEAPVVVGHFRPVILMPLDLLGRLPAGQMDAILLHELAHIRRHDYLVNVLQRLVEGLLFYHPAVWWISSVVRREREHCCDDAVVAVRGDAHEYARALAALEEFRGPGQAQALAATGGNLVKRIRRLLYPQGTNGTWTPVLTALILVVALSATLAAWQANTKSDPTPPRAAGAAASPYMKWLDEDVVYIIDDAERAAFLKLTSNPEREKFIEQFWLRRSQPGATSDAAKVEHYRRISYAIERFGNSLPGWRTDRGRMYIIYGPPDEIESHPGKAELWLYHTLPGIGANVTLTFIDKTGRGDLRLAPGNGRWSPGN
ncbi:M56 family metallopeptidase [uncultured Paludibaculum sp.]|uniref:M56 family metallopeptidase n=1 Tax=uncultured Paludibaculum sp. TaxID=1765020 RepID=UPI002AAA6529|nr:M56 family metallopeptidase [uncultured Paludibaculum sp.]